VELAAPVTGKENPVEGKVGAAVVEGVSTTALDTPVPTYVGTVPVEGKVGTSDDVAAGRAVLSTAELES
jgi:hypothetical protein